MDISKLTDEEIAWYAERDWVLDILGNYSCGLCQYRSPDDLLCIFRECPKFNADYKDAAEFEARVAATLAEGPEDCQECFWGAKGLVCRQRGSSPQIRPPRRRRGNGKGGKMKNALLEIVGLALIIPAMLIGRYCLEPWGGLFWLSVCAAMPFHVLGVRLLRKTA